MEGQTYIDNIDIYTQYGVWITKDGYNDLLLFPDLIEPEKNIWNEEDGIEVDLEHPILNAKEVIIPFAAGDPLPDTEEFIRFLSRPGYRILRIPSLGKEWELRLLAQTANKTYPGANLFSLRFADDSSPRVEIYEPAAGGGISLPGSPYSIDGQPFDKYGIVVESGRDSLLQMAAVKQNLTQQFSTIDGRMYDVGHLRFNSKEVTFKCCFITASMELFWQCYTAFFNDLIQPKERQLHYNSTGKSYPCYYKQTSGFRMLHNNGRVVAEFSLTLVFTSFRAGESEYLLATEDGALIITEDNCPVDLNPVRPQAIPDSQRPLISVHIPRTATLTNENKARSATLRAAETEEGEEKEEPGLRKVKISEMPEATNLENLIVPAVDKKTNRNVHVPASLLKANGEGGTGGETGNKPFDGQLGDLKNVDKAFDSLANGKYAFEMKNGLLCPIEVSTIGGSGSSLKVTFVSNGVSAVAYGESAFISYHFSSTLDGSDTGPGTATYTVNDKPISTITIKQGENTFDTGKYLILGSNTVKVEVTDSYGSSRTLTYSIEAVSISISSTFDASQPFTGDVTYKYTPIGAIEKTVHFIVDGTEIGSTVTSLTNRQQTYPIPAQTHGSHTLEVYITAQTEGSTLTSNRLHYELICLTTGTMTPVIASPFISTKAEQYSTLQIPYVVYNPAALLSQVTLSVNGEEVSTLNVDRTQQIWSYRISRTEELILTITCNDIVKKFAITVTGSAIGSEATTAGLELYLSSMGRSNSEINKSVWKYKEIAASLTDFNFSTNGWVTDNNGNKILRVSGEARVEIPLKVFANDLRINGKTIEFEFSTSHVTDYEALIISCWDNGKGIKITAQKALFVSTQTSVEVQFKEEERVRISFVIEETAENRLIYTYINGICSGVVQYPSNDSFAQVNPASIHIGNNSCTVDLYTIRVYENNLNQYQILDNYIADMDDMNKKVTLYERNQIYDAYGEIVYSRVLEQLPCMTLIGELPNYKGDKKTISLIYENKQDPSKSFTASQVQIDVQGTSSQYYLRKNYKTKFKKGVTMSQSGEQLPVYKLRDDSIAVDAFCEKADFAESSGTHNTGMAKIIDTTMKKLGYQTPPQKQNSLIRTTIDGFPILIFHKETAESPAGFVGKYNFNNDKSTQDTFGFSGDAECWEFKNNTSDRVLFLKSDYTQLDDGGTPDWLNDFEARYPDDDALNAEYAGGKIPVKFKRLTDWIVSTNGNTAKFREECAAYFDMNYLLTYYVITELFAMVDQRAKNMFFATWDGTHWFPIFYDNDTCNGINNEGDVAFGYHVEYHDSIGTQQVFNGESSVLWKNVETCFESEITALYQKIRVENILSYEHVIEIMNTEQSSRWCEAIYNADGLYKYIYPLINGYYDYGTNQFVYTGAYLYAMQGSRSEHRKWWLYNRFRYMDSKYNTGNYVSDYATMRLYTPENWTGIAPDANFHITPYADQYLRVKFGSYGTKSIRSVRGKATVIEAPASQKLNDTETIIYGASRLKSLGDLSAKYASTIDVSKAVRLEELIIGNEADGYHNTNLKTLAIGNNKMMRRLNVMNCPNLTQAIDVSGCENIEEIYAEGSAVTGVVLASGGNLKVFRLPDTIRSLTIKNQPKLTDAGFSMAGVTFLTTLVLENTRIDTFALLARCFSQSIYALERVRLIDVAGTTESTSLLARLAQMGGVDENGNDISKAIVTGVCTVAGVYKDDYQILKETFPELVINYKFIWIKFADPAVKAICVSIWDTDADGELTEEEAGIQRIVTDTTFAGNEQIVSFDEFKYFTFYSNSHSLFMGCTALKRISFPLDNMSLTNGIRYRICRGCTSLEQVGIPDGITTIGPEAFWECISLDKVVLPDSLTIIDTNAFKQCSSLSTITIPAGVTHLNGSAFEGCTHMKSMILLPEIPPVPGYRTFNNNDTLFYVPDGAVETYKSAAGWTVFSARIHPASTLKK